MNINTLFDVLQRFKHATLPYAERVLDIGAGTCNFKDLYPWLDAKITFLDMDDSDGNFFNMARAALKDEDNYSFVTSTSDDLSMFEDGSFDMVIFSHVIEHLTFEQRDKTMSEISRVLRRGGIMSLSTPARNGRKLVGKYKAHPGHVEEYSHEELNKFITEAGFVIRNNDYCVLKVEEDANDTYNVTFTLHNEGDKAYAYYYVCEKL